MHDSVKPYHKSERDFSEKVKKFGTRTVWLSNDGKRRRKNIDTDLSI